MSNPAGFVAHLVYGHESEWIAAGAGALAAIAGAFLSVAWAEYFNLTRRKRDLKERSSIGALALYNKLNHIYSLTLVLRKHLDSEILNAILAGSPFLTTLVRPIFRSGDPVEFTIDEKWTALQIGGKDLVNKQNALDISFNDQSRVLALYVGKREELFSMMPPNRVNGITGEVSLSADQFSRIHPSIINLDGILRQTHDHSVQLLNDSLGALRLLVYAREKPLGEDFGIKLHSMDGSMITIGATDGSYRWDWFLGFPYRTGRGSFGADLLAVDDQSPRD